MGDKMQTNETSMSLGPRPLGDAAPHLVVCAGILTAAISAGLCAAAILAPAPVAAVPFVVAICIGAPVFASWQVPVAVAMLREQRRERSARKAMVKLRRTLEALPETEHPLGL